MTVLRVPPLTLLAAGTSVQTQVLDGTDDSSSLLFVAAKTGNIVEIGAYCSAASGTPTITGSLEGITGGATPTSDGTPVTGGATVGITPTSAAWNVWTLGTPAAVTVGQQCAAQLKYSSGSGSATIDRGYSVSGGLYGNPYTGNLANGTLSASNTFLPTIYVRYDDGTIQGVAARASSIAAGWATGTNPLKGNKWTPAATVLVDGIYAAIRPAAGFDFMAEMYTAGSGTPVASVGTFEGDKAFASQSVVQWGFFPFGAEYALAGGTAHRFVLRATTANAPTEAILLTFKDSTTFNGRVGSEWAHTVNNAQDDSWTDTENAICAIYPRVVGVVTSGGLLRHPGMSGGANG